MGIFKQGDIKPMVQVQKMNSNWCKLGKAQRNPTKNLRGTHW